MGRLIGVRLGKQALFVLRELDRALDHAYGAPEHVLDNKRDPLDEAVYIILTFQTDLERSKHVWVQLREAFPRWDDLARAPLDRMAGILRAGGLQEQKAGIIRSLLHAVKEQTGGLSLNSLQDMNDSKAERVLLSLPGLSWKGARCVLLYSLDRAVFPIDGNTFRILKRVGVLPAGSVYRRRGLHDRLQQAVEPARRKPFHINLVVHGQRTCLPRNPRCCICWARYTCLMKSVSPEMRAATGANLSAVPDSRNGMRT